MATALAGVEREGVEKMVAQLAIMKENLRQAIQNQTLLLPTLRENNAMAERALKPAAPAREEAPDVRERPPAARPSDLRESASKEESAPLRPSAFGYGWGLFALLPLALLIGGLIGTSPAAGSCRRDNAYVNAETVGISTDIAGIVKEVNVTENQHVAAGQILYRLDPLQFQIALDNAKANLAQTALTIESMKEDYKRMLSDAAAQQAQVELDQTNYDRATMLLHNDTVPQSELRCRPKPRSTSTRASSNPSASRPRVQLGKARRQSGHSGDPAPTISRRPRPRSTRRSASSITPSSRAPFGGIVTNVPSIAPGKYLAASTTAFFLVDTDHVWIDANPKETELTYVRPGQPVTVTVDTYPDAGMARHRREHQSGCGAAIRVAACAKHQRQLGESRTARADARARRHQRQELNRRCAPA